MTKLCIGRARFNSGAVEGKHPFAVRCTEAARVTNGVPQAGQYCGLRTLTASRKQGAYSV